MEGVEEKLGDLQVAQKGAKKAKEKENTSAFPLELNPPPAFLEERIKLFDKLKAEYDAEVLAKAEENRPIKVTLPDGKQLDGIAWKTTPYSLAASISQGLADNTVIAKVNDEVFDLDRPLENDCTLKFLKFDDREEEVAVSGGNVLTWFNAGDVVIMDIIRHHSNITSIILTSRALPRQQVFWHSSAHIMGEAMEKHYGGLLCYGPPIEEGFYYDMFSKDRQVSSNDFASLEKLMKSAVKEKQKFVRLEMKREDLREMFKYNPFKLRIIDERIKTDTTTVYRCGPLIDLCRGPHVRHTGKCKSIALTKNSATYWEGNCEAESLQRIYGISFPQDKQLKEWKKLQEEAAKRDHRKIGKEQELFFFHELSPGSCFFLPNGAHIYNTLMNFIKEEYWKRGFQEVITPNIYSTKLWETSGHWKHYSENLFSFEVEKELYALKPMNCPGHCVMFDHRPRSWRELPLRMADFGVLHRNELSGTLSGLTRVRRFQQDDAHIFCTMEQISDEINGCLDFLRSVYTVFGFTFKVELSTRPDKFMGEKETWDDAEAKLSKALDDFGQKWELNPGDGAFYGPKIDIQILDALRRSHQCATIQLDFQLPERFNLHYISGEGDEKRRPVIIHRAILGSVERMIAILTESYGGKWPLWLSPRQAIVIPVSNKYDDYAKQVETQLHDAGFRVTTDLDHGSTLNKKIRNSQLAQYNFILVVGDNEMTSQTVNVRTRDNKVHGERTISDVIARFRDHIARRSLNSEDDF